MKEELKEKGYAHDDVPIWGRIEKFPEFCDCDLNCPKDRSCGCGTGQCEKGLIC